MARSWSVILASALTTTTGRSGRRSRTMAATRSMAWASCTEVPPNFITIMGTPGGKSVCTAEARRRGEKRSVSQEPQASARCHWLASKPEGPLTANLHPSALGIFPFNQDHVCHRGDVRWHRSEKNAIVRRAEAETFGRYFPAVLCCGNEFFTVLTFVNKSVPHKFLYIVRFHLFK